MRTSAVAYSAAAAALLGALTGCGTLTPNAGPLPSTPAATVSGAGSSPSATPSEAAPLPTGSGGTPRPGLPHHVDGTSADAVSRAALTVMWTMDTITDTSQYNATLRAAPYLTDSYAARLKAAPPRSGPGADWQTWIDHRAWTSVRLELVRPASAITPTATARAHTSSSARDRVAVTGRRSIRPTANRTGPAALAGTARATSSRRRPSGDCSTTLSM